MAGWSTTDKAAGITVSSGGALATDNAGVAWSMVRADTALPAGKKSYFEIPVVLSQGKPPIGAFLDGWIAGLANSAQLLSGFVGSSNNSAGYATDAFDDFFSVMQFLINGADTLCTDHLLTGRILCVAADLANSPAKVWGRVCGSDTWNNLLAPNVGAPTAGTGGFSISALGTPLYPAFASKYLGNAAGINLGGPFACLIPTDFSPVVTTPSASSIRPFLWALT
jgi:hypothetical protein